MLNLSKIQFAEQKDDKEPGVTHICGMMTIGAAGKVEDKTAPPREAIHQSIKETIWNSVYGELRGPMLELSNAIHHDQMSKCRSAFERLTSLLVIKNPSQDEILKQLNSLQANGKPAITGE